MKTINDKQNFEPIREFVLSAVLIGWAFYITLRLFTQFILGAWIWN